MQIPDRAPRVAWAAGFVDGEGSIGVWRGNAVNRHGRLKISVSQRDPRPLELLRELWGGAISPRLSKQPDRAPSSVWDIVGPGAARALDEMLPYLVVKYEHARIGIAYQRLMNRPGRKIIAPEDLKTRAAYEAALRVLNAKGLRYRPSTLIPAAFETAFVKPRTEKI